MARSPGSNATVLATLDDGPDRAAVFFYPGGAAMPGGRAPAKRVGWFLNDRTAVRWTPEIRALFQSTLRWALGAG